MAYFATKRNGFSYVELVFVIAILAVLASVAVPYLEKNIQRKKESELKQNLRQIRAAIDEYKVSADQGKIKKSIGDSGYPHNLEDLVNGVEDITDPQKKKLRFLRNIPADPMFTRSVALKNELAPADTWGKRSYSSDADNPREGDDVFDVYSLSSEIGLNGIPYGQW
ncbi:MAG: type II secretion system protein [Methylotenera sp.]|uniref:type II secretion system protein n=1 Tax=Methylotenera sp. TaxID=2051956 RepID=UPI00180EED20|nr:type II secretion system protein [Methylotenera sp.]NOU25055.1 type II secretion system protein [Methylotenera sp.]